MSLHSTKGVGVSECHRGKPRRDPSVSYVQEVSEDTGTTATTSVTTAGGTVEKHPKFTGGTNEDHVLFSVRILGLVKKIRTAAAIREANAVLQDYPRKLAELKAEQPQAADFVKSKPPEGASTGDDASKEGSKKAKDAASRKKASKKHAPSADGQDPPTDESDDDDASDDKSKEPPPPPPVKLSNAERKEYNSAVLRWNKELAALKEERESARKDLAEAQERPFAVADSLLDESHRSTWAAIVSRVCDEPTTDDDGNTIKEAPGKTIATFRRCMVEFMLTVLPADAAENQKNYMTHHLKKSPKMTVRATIARLQVLNGYLPHLPCLADSEDAAPNTARENTPFSDAAVCSIIMRMIPGDWEAQYYLTEKYIPSDVRKLQNVLERIESAKSVQRQSEQHKQKQASTGSASKPGKRSGEEPKGRIPKKARSERTEKHCIHCKKNGGPFKTHNTLECRIYDKDGKRKFEGRNSSRDKASKAAYAQVLTKMEKLERKLLKAKKSSKKRKRVVESDSSDSDSD